MDEPGILTYLGMISLGNNFLTAPQGEVGFTAIVLDYEIEVGPHNINLNVKLFTSIAKLRNTPPSASGVLPSPSNALGARKLLAGEIKPNYPNRIENRCYPLLPDSHLIRFIFCCF